MVHAGKLGSNITADKTMDIPDNGNDRRKNKKRTKKQQGLN